MRQIPSDLIRPGFRLPGGLCDKSGRVLIPAGTELTEGDLAKLGRRLITGVYGGDDWPADPPPGQAGEPDVQTTSGTRAANAPSGASQAPAAVATRAGTRLVNVDVLRVGMRLTQSIYDRSGVLLLAAGNQVTARLLHLLRQRGLEVVHLERAGLDSAERDLERRANEMDALLDAAFRQGVPALRLRGALARPTLPLADLSAEARRGLEYHVLASGILADLGQKLMAGGSASGDEIHKLISDFADMLMLDFDLLPTILSMQKTLGDYLFDHCINVALMSMTIAVGCGCSHQQALAIGLGAVFHDLGMLQVPAEIRLARRALTPEQTAIIERHPTYSLECLERIRGVPVEARFIGYQAHERLDKSGYPRQRSSTTTHPFAKIVAVADVYCAMTRSRPYRSALVPHDAVKHILKHGSLGRLDRAILRAFLDNVSAFPIGSRVELNDGTIGKVVRANAGAHTRPVILVPGSDANDTSRCIDLATQPRIEVVRALHPEDQA